VENKFLFFIFLFPILSAGEIFVATFEITKSGEIKNFSYEIEEGSIRFTLPGPYTGSLVDEKGKELSKVNFTVDFIIFTEPPKELEEQFILLTLPWRSEAKEFVLRYKEKILATFNIEICNKNKICEKNENFLICYYDCPSGSSDNYCDGAIDFKCDPDCAPSADVDCSGITIAVLAVISIFAILSVLFLLRKKLKR